MVNKREAIDINDIYDYVCALVMYRMSEVENLSELGVTKV